MTSKSSLYAIAINRADRFELTTTLMSLTAAQAQTDPEKELGFLTQAVVSLTTESYANRTSPAQVHQLFRELKLLDGRARLTKNMTMAA